MLVQQRRYAPGDIVMSEDVWQEGHVTHHEYSTGIIIDTDFRPTRVLVDNEEAPDDEYALYGVLWDDGTITYALARDLKLVTE